MKKANENVNQVRATGGCMYRIVYLTLIVLSLCLMNQSAKAQVGVSTGLKTALLVTTQFQQNTFLGLTGSLHTGKLILSLDLLLDNPYLFAGDISYRHYDKERHSVFVSGHVGGFLIDRFGGATIAGGVGYLFKSGLELHFKHTLLFTENTGTGSSIVALTGTLLSVSISYTLFKPKKDK